MSCCPLCVGFCAECLSHCPFPKKSHSTQWWHPGEQYVHYLPRTKQHWLKLARNNLGPDAKEKKVLKVAQAMAETFVDDSVQDVAEASSETEGQ